MSDYRNRIYKNYLNTCCKSLAPDDLESLKPRYYLYNMVIENYFPVDKNAKILDLGCGYGAFVHCVRLAGYSDVIGIDISPQQIEESKRLGIQGVVQSDILDFLRSSPDESKDVIITFDVIEHFAKDELIIFIDEVYRVLTKRGKWIMHVPNGESPFFGKVRYGDYTHEVAFTRSSITQLLKCSGFLSIACGEDMPTVHNLRSAIHWIMWKFVRFACLFYLLAESGSIEKNSMLTQNFIAVAEK